MPVNLWEVGGDCTCTHIFLKKNLEVSIMIFNFTSPNETKMNKIETFKQLREYLREIPFINNGGCAIAAVTMHRWLKQNGENSSIIFFYASSDGSYYYNKKIQQQQSYYEAESCGHAMIKYKGRFKDCSAKPIHRFLKKHHVVSEDFAVRAINDGSWNNSFQRKIFVKEIQENTGVDLSDIKIK